MIRITRKRLAVVTMVLLLFAGILVLAWEVCDWPPPRLVLKYGFPPAGGPTGRRETVEGVEFIELSAGYFRMGSHLGCSNGDLIDHFLDALGIRDSGSRRHLGYECPPHWVEVPRPFWVSRLEVTNLQYERFDREHERCEYSMHDNDPVVEVSWEDASEYCLWLSRQTGRTVRLPSEAEWEFVARGGGSSLASSSSERADQEATAWFDANSGDRAQRVGTGSLNQWGVADLRGNVAEWCLDRWHHSYEGGPREAVPWLSGTTDFRVVRGGHFGSPIEELSVSFRSSWTESTGWVNIGFRLVQESRRED